MKLSCPYFGPYTKAINEFGSLLRCDFIEPVSPSEKTIELGTKALTSELMCLPAKVTLGCMIEACEKGATDLIMFDSCGLCRLKTYWILQQHSLNKMGYTARVHPIRLGWPILHDIKGLNPKLSYWQAAKAFFRLSKRVFEIDRELWPVLDENSDQIKIGIVGEIYTILEPTVNQRLVEKLRKMGAQVHNSLPLSYYIFKRLYDWGLLKREGIDRKVLLEARKLAHKYFPKEIGGHGNESITYTIYYAKKKYDGVLHLLPFPCMPEATVSPIVDEISHKYKIPVMRLIFDTHTAEAGLNTRLEAFVDILKRKKDQQKRGIVK